MYNEELKNRFLELYKPETAKTYRDSFLQISEMEEFYDKDVFKFTTTELHETLKGLGAKTPKAVQRITTPIIKYIEWANQEGYIENKFDFTSLFSGDRLKDYVWVHASKNSYFSREEIYLMCDELVNALDKALLICPLEGINGENHSEITLLKASDINFSTGEIHLTDINGCMRTIVVKDKRSLDIFYNASKQDMYVTRNGNSVNIVEKPLMDSPYLFRIVTLSFNNTRTEEPVRSLFISGKFIRFFKGTRKRGKITERPYIKDYPFLNLTNIFKSGFFDYCLNLEKERGELSTDDYKEVCIRYGVNVNLYHSYKTQYLEYRERIKRGR